MAGWRDDVSEQAGNDLDKLYFAAVEMAKKLLEKNDELFPVGVALMLDGTTEYVGVDAAVLGATPTATDVIDALYDTFRSFAPTFRAVGMAIDIHIATLDTDAIDVRMEHSEGFGLAVQLPYRQDAATGEYVYAAAIATDHERSVWP